MKKVKIYSREEMLNWEHLLSWATEQKKEISGKV